MEGKICKKCNTLKPYSEFNKHKETKDGYRTLCKKCQSEYNKNFRKKNINYYKEYWKEYYRNNKDKEFLKIIKWREKNSEKYKVYYTKYHVENSEKRLEYNRKWRTLNREKVNKRSRDRRRENIKFNLSGKLRLQINRYVKQGYKSESTYKLLGCTKQEFLDYIQSLFIENMSIDKLLSGEIHLDHIRPLSSFSNLQQEIQQKEAFHYTNYQPLFASDNLSKQDKWEGYSINNTTIERITFLENLYQEEFKTLIIKLNDTFYKKN